MTNFDFLTACKGHDLGDEESPYIRAWCGSKVISIVTTRVATEVGVGGTFSPLASIKQAVSLLLYTSRVLQYI